MDTLNSDLETLENLSKKISDLIHDNEFANISYLDSQRRLLIEKIKNSEIRRVNIKKRIEKLIENNLENIKATEKKLENSSKNHIQFSKRLKAYSMSKK